MPPTESFRERTYEETDVIRSMVFEVCEKKGIIFYNTVLIGSSISYVDLYSVGVSNKASESVFFQAQVGEAGLLTPTRLKPTTSVLAGPQEIITGVKNKLKTTKEEKPANQAL